MTPSKQIFSELKLLPFPERVKYHTHVMMYKILNNMAPKYLRQLIHNVSETHERALRSADNELLTIPLCRTTYYTRLSVGSPCIFKKRYLPGSPSRFSVKSAIYTAAGCQHIIAIYTAAVPEQIRTIYTAAGCHI